MNTILKENILNQISNSEDIFTVNLCNSVKEIYSKAKNTEELWKKYSSNIFKNYIEPHLDEDYSNFSKLMKEYNLEDIHWNWMSKALKYNNENYLWFILEIDSTIEGIAIIFHPKKSYLCDNQIFYIDYLATAPWNRNSKINNKKYRGIGSILIKSITYYCINEYNYSFGFSLHSLPNAEKYYHNIGMKNLGNDIDYSNLVLFEMEENKCKEFLNQGGC